MQNDRLRTDDGEISMPPARRRTSCSAAAASQGVLSTSAPMLVPQWPNDRWSLDFVADQFIDGPSPVELDYGSFTGSS